MDKNTLILNLYGGPGTGKSTGATYIFSHLKLAGIDAEYVSEFAKDKVWEQNDEVFKCQFYVSGKQAFKIFRCFGKVDVIVTDCPVRMGKLYAEKINRPELGKACSEEANAYKDNSIDIFLKRVKAYNPNGRHQTEEQAKALDDEIKNILINDGVEFLEVEGSKAGYDKIISVVIGFLNNLKGNNQ